MKVGIDSYRERGSLSSSVFSSKRDFRFFPAIPTADEPSSPQVLLFGSNVSPGQIETIVILLTVAGIILFLAASALLGFVIHLERQKRLRRNRRSILDEGFKLMSTKNYDI